MLYPDWDNPKQIYRLETRNNGNFLSNKFIIEENGYIYIYSGAMNGIIYVVLNEKLIGGMQQSSGSDNNFTDFDIQILPVHKNDTIQFRVVSSTPTNPNGSNEVNCYLYPYRR